MCECLKLKYTKCTIYIATAVCNRKSQLLKLSQDHCSLVINDNRIEHDTIYRYYNDF
jgi:hypothetical protein